MQDFLNRLADGLSGLARYTLWIAGTGLVLMTAFVGWQVFGRYVLNDSPVWTEPMAILLMGWFIFLGAAVGVREGYHLSFDVLLHVLPETARSLLHSISDVVVVAFGIGMVICGIQMSLRTWGATMPTLGLPGGAAFFALIAGGLLTVLFTLERLVRRLAGAGPAVAQVEPALAEG